MEKGFVSIGVVVFFILAGLPVAVLAAAYVVVQQNQKYIVASPQEAGLAVDTPPRTVIVFGSGLRGDNGEPRPVLTARLEAALDLYRAGAVDRIIASGHVEPRYNEPRAMLTYLAANGVPDHAIVADSEGSSTFDTCKRARSVFGVSEAVLVTQSSHLSRAIYLCRAYGVEAYGYAADSAGSRTARYFQQVRELGSNVRAVLDALTSGQTRRQ